MAANLIFRLLQAADAQDSSWNYSPQLDRFLLNPDDVILFKPFATPTEGLIYNVIIDLQLKFCSKQPFIIEELHPAGWQSAPFSFPIDTRMYIMMKCWSQ